MEKRLIGCSFVRFMYFVGQNGALQMNHLASCCATERRRAGLLNKSGDILLCGVSESSRKSSRPATRASLELKAIGTIYRN